MDQLGFVFMRAVNLLVNRSAAGAKCPAILLVGLLLKAFLGCGVQIPLAALIMVPIIAKEGIAQGGGEVRGARCADCCTVMSDLHPILRTARQRARKFIVFRWMRHFDLVERICIVWLGVRVNASSIAVLRRGRGKKCRVMG